MHFLNLSDTRHTLLRLRTKSSLDDRYVDAENAFLYLPKKLVYIIDYDNEKSDDELIEIDFGSSFLDLDPRGILEELKKDVTHWSKIKWQ